jgi:hypothetical protein
MSSLRVRLVRFAPWTVLTVALLACSPREARAQFYGYGGFGFPAYGYGGLGFGYGGLGFGYGGLGFGYGGYGYGGYPASYGYGYPGGGYGGYNYGYPGLGVTSFGVGYGGFSPYLVPSLNNWNPYFGLGLSPLGVQSAVTETAIMRGAASSSRGYVAIPR